MCNEKPKGLKTQYQQITRYYQDKNIKTPPKELMRRDFAKQCGLWRKNDERLIIIIDANKSTIDGPPKKMPEKVWSYKSFLTSTMATHPLTPS